MKGGRILEDLYDTKIDALNPEAGIDFKNVVYEGSDRLWHQSLRDPASMVNWIIVNPADPHDLVAQRLTPAFNAQFTRDIEEANGLSLFHRNGLSFPTRPVPSFLLTEHTLCTESNSADSAWPRQPQDVLWLYRFIHNLETDIRPLHERMG